MKMILNTVRMVDYDQAREHVFGDEQTLKEKLAIGLINPKDFEKLGLVPSLRIKISNKYGEIIIEQTQDEKVPEGTILMPISIWANRLTGVIENDVIFKNIEVNVEPTRDPVLNFKEIISAIKD